MAAGGQGGPMGAPPPGAAPGVGPPRHGRAPGAGAVITTSATGGGPGAVRLPGHGPFRPRRSTALPMDAVTAPSKGALARWQGDPTESEHAEPALRPGPAPNHRDRPPTSRRAE